VSQQTWTAVDDYLSELIVRPDAALAAALADSQAAGLPEIAVSAAQGKLLNLLARAMGARRILEIGTLGGYSAIWLARSLPPGGRLISLEYSPKHAQVARANLARAGLASVSEVRVGAGLELLAGLTGPFDLFFIDADKTGYPDYFRGCLRLSRPGSVMIFDNMVREGEIMDPASRDPSVRAVRQLYEDIAAEPRAAATAVQTVGSKGYDGFCMVVVSP
jgi:predicted O-methyltransferase YrrM